MNTPQPFLIGKELAAFTQLLALDARKFAETEHAPLLNLARAHWQPNEPTDCDPPTTGLLPASAISCEQINNICSHGLAPPQGLTKKNIDTSESSFIHKNKNKNTWTIGLANIDNILVSAASAAVAVADASPTIDIGGAPATALPLPRVASPSSLAQVAAQADLAAAAVPTIARAPPSLLSASSSPPDNTTNDGSLDALAVAAVNNMSDTASAPPFHRPTQLRLRARRSSQWPNLLPLLVRVAAMAPSLPATLPLHPLSSLHRHCRRHRRLHRRLIRNPSLNVNISSTIFNTSSPTPQNGPNIAANGENTSGGSGGSGSQARGGPAINGNTGETQAAPATPLTGTVIASVAVAVAALVVVAGFTGYIRMRSARQRRKKHVWHLPDSLRAGGGPPHHHPHYNPHLHGSFGRSSATGTKPQLPPPTAAGIHAHGSGSSSASTSPHSSMERNHWQAAGAPMSPTASISSFSNYGAHDPGSVYPVPAGSASFPVVTYPTGATGVQYAAPIGSPYTVSGPPPPPPPVSAAASVTSLQAQVAAHQHQHQLQLHQAYQSSPPGVRADIPALPAPTASKHARVPVRAQAARFFGNAFRRWSRSPGMVTTDATGGSTVSSSLGASQVGSTTAGGATSTTQASSSLESFGNNSPMFSQGIMDMTTSTSGGGASPRDAGNGVLVGLPPMPSVSDVSLGGMSPSGMVMAGWSRPGEHGERPSTIMSAGGLASIAEVSDEDRSEGRDTDVPSFGYSNASAYHQQAYHGHELDAHYHGGGSHNNTAMYAGGPAHNGFPTFNSSTSSSADYSHNHSHAIIMSGGSSEHTGAESANASASSFNAFYMYNGQAHVLPSPGMSRRFEGDTGEDDPRNRDTVRESVASSVMSAEKSALQRRWDRFWAVGGEHQQPGDEERAEAREMAERK
ncbi:hypothetical protein BCR44DRAFT_1485515 [Catenaria anguillulae PL171]|uniref:Uncharacterized protein n=1 Tax=Catenaria anguillulae PL171 TaxID=765915 RepID=A0A1Y2HK74_9FUNG|nr:hypothetical protein BCR44DRAFT_1485515 [Catenaria anguillulae PL171]